VILILSKEFISKPYPMEELHMLLHWQRQGSPVKLLPVFYSISPEGITAQIDKYQAAAGWGGRLRNLWGNTTGSQCEQQWAADLQGLQQWVTDLEKLGGITGVRSDQVGRIALLRAACKQCADVQLIHSQLGYPHSRAVTAVWC
jgi:hypothetical protein